jgi:type IV fimbrial biogenesis protein FimT
MLKTDPTSLIACIPNKHAGFTLIELMITVVLLGILLSIAAPSFQAMILNNRVRNAAESVVNGIQQARAEAVARNASVSFTMQADTSWVINAVASGDTIASRSGSEGSREVDMAMLNPGATEMVTFNSLGMIGATSTQITNADGSNPFTVLEFSIPNGTRKYVIMVGACDMTDFTCVGSSPRMCDPDLAPGSSLAACTQ